LGDLRDSPPGPDRSLPNLQEHVEGKASVFLNPDRPIEDALDELFRLPQALEAIEGKPSRLAGTVTTWLWHPPWMRDPGVHVRQYAHGGALGRFTRTTFLGSARMIDEFRIAVYARRMGVPTSVPLALRIERVYGPFVRGHILTELMPETQNLLELCAESNALPGRPRHRSRLVDAVAEAVCALHDAGIVHADLNLKNILARGPWYAPEAFIIDFDKARLAIEVSFDERMVNLVRLERSVLKWTASRSVIRPRDRLRMLRTYLRQRPEWAGQWRRLARPYLASTEP